MHAFDQDFSTQTMKLGGDQIWL